MSVETDCGTTSRRPKGGGSYSNRKRKRLPGHSARKLVGVSSRKGIAFNGHRKIACGGQGTLQFDDRPFQAGVQEPNPSTHRDGGKVRRVELCFHVESIDLVPAL